jgi:peptidylprolyl isomerase
MAAVAIPACAQKDVKAQPEKQQAAAPAGAAVVKTPSGLIYSDLVVGNGPSPSVGKMVKVHYTGTLENGTKFDSSVDRGQPFTFPIGVGQVIPGWDEGVMSMKVGGKRKLTIPPDLGYGAAGAGGVIPPNATLLFDVELLDVEK